MDVGARGREMRGVYTLQSPRGARTVINARYSSFIRLIHSSPSRGPALTLSSGSFCTVDLVCSSGPELWHEHTQRKPYQQARSAGKGPSARHVGFSTSTLPWVPPSSISPVFMQTFQSSQHSLAPTL